MRSPGAVYTLVRTSSIDATRPSKEMQSGNVAIRIALAQQHPHQRQHQHQRMPESSRQEHQAGGIDGKSPKELLGANLAHLRDERPDELLGRGKCLGADSMRRYRV